MAKRYYGIPYDKIKDKFDNECYKIFVKELKDRFSHMKLPGIKLIATILDTIDHVTMFIETKKGMPYETAVNKITLSCVNSCCAAGSFVTPEFIVNEKIDTTVLESCNADIVFRRI